jgi:hypothetical protein
MVPVSEFLTGVGTIALAILTVFLANRKPKDHIELSVTIRQNQSLVVEMLNDGYTLPVIRTWYWRAPCLGRGRLELPAIADIVRQQSIVPLPLRMERGDLLVGSVTAETIAQIADQRIEQNVTPEALRACMRGSRFGCATTTGSVFEIQLPVAASSLIAERLVLRRPAI